MAQAFSRQPIAYTEPRPTGPDNHSVENIGTIIHCRVILMIGFPHRRDN
jgi:hypothetical protein